MAMVSYLKEIADTTVFQWGSNRWGVQMILQVKVIVCIRIMKYCISQI